MSITQQARNLFKNLQSGASSVGNFIAQDIQRTPQARTISSISQLVPQAPKFAQNVVKMAQPVFNQPTQPMLKPFGGFNFPPMPEIKASFKKDIQKTSQFQALKAAPQAVKFVSQALGNTDYDNSSIGKLMTGNFQGAIQAIPTDFQRANKPFQEQRQVINSLSGGKKFSQLTPEEQQKVIAPSLNLAMGTLGPTSSGIKSNQLGKAYDILSHDLGVVYGNLGRKFTKSQLKNVIGRLSRMGVSDDFAPELNNAIKTSHFIDGVERGLVGNKPSIGLATRDISKELSPNQVKGKTKLSELVNYPKDLLSRGYSQKQIDKIGVSEYRNIVKDNTPPFVHESFNEVTGQSQLATPLQQLREQSTKTFSQNSRPGEMLGKLPGKVSQAQLPKGQSFDEILSQSVNDVKKKVNIIDYLRTPDRVFRKIGLGQEAKLLRTQYDGYLQQLPKEIDKVTAWSKQVDRGGNERIFNYLDGKLPRLDNPKELQVATEIKKYLSEWADKLDLPKEQRISNYITHIFEKGKVTKEFDPEVAKIIQGKVVGSVYDPFLQRRVGMPEYKKDTWQALDAYVKRATRKYYMDQALEKVATKAENLPLESFNYVKGRIARINMQPTEIDNLIDNAIKSSPIGYKLGQRPVTSVTQNARRMVSRGLLGLNPGSALRNLQQSTNTYAVTGEKNFAYGVMKTIQNMPRYVAGKDTELEKLGILGDDIIQDRSLNATRKFWEKADKAFYYMFGQAEKINRSIAFYAGKSQGLSKGMTEEQAIAHAKSIVAKTQFLYDTIDTPAALQSDLAKTMFQFGKYPVAQTEFLLEMLKNPSKKQAIAQSIRWTAANLLFVGTAGKLLGLEPKDLFPQFRFGVPPTLQAPVEAGKAVLNVPDKYGNTSDEPNPLLRLMDSKGVQRGLMNYVPAGGQIRKTVEGIDAYQQGQSETPTGRTRFEIDQNPFNFVRAAALGQYSLPGAQDYFNNIGKSESEIIFNEFKKAKTNEEKSALFDQMVKDGRISKANLSDLKQYAVDQSIGLTTKEKSIRSMSVRNGARARKVIEEIQRESDQQKKADLLEKYIKAKIITPEVAKQMRLILSAQ